MAEISHEDIEVLADFANECRHDPYKFVMLAFPWGEGSLEGKDGPDEWQVAILKEIGEGLKNPGEIIREAVASGHGIGKLHAYDMELYTPKGKVKWGDLRVGDKVFTPEGTATIVQEHHYRQVPMYRVTFDDGSFCDVSSGHLWSVRGRSERRNKKDGWRTLSTLDIINLGVLRKNGKAMAKQWELPRHSAVEYPEKEVRIAPYLMGTWLSDGAKGKPLYTKNFSEVDKRIENAGYEVTHNGKAHYVRGIKHIIKTMPVFDTYDDERYIPEEYKLNSKAVRFELLQGLMDGDGECAKHGSLIYSSTSRRLIDDVAWLARSLGGKAYKPTKKQGAYKDKNGNLVKCKDCWRIVLTLPFNPFTVKAKAKRWHYPQERYLKRWIAGIKEIGRSDGMCITVDKQDGLYLANDFIVTHNSALVAWLILWAIGTCPNTRGVVTANTETQLRTKTWPELAKWYQLWILKDLFEYTATAIFSREGDKEKTWRIDAVPWSKQNTEAFAGLHNEGNRTVVIFDEASAIENVIWEVAEGAMTDDNTEIIWCAFGNPTRNSGRFYDCFHKQREYWNTRQIDSRSVKISNKRQLEEWRKLYGEDSDWYKVRVRGEFPSASDKQFIPTELVEEARRRGLRKEQFDFAAVVIGVDPAWTGADALTIYLRQGLYCKRLLKMAKNENDVVVAGIIARFEDEYRADAVFIDLGYGTGIKSAGEAWGRSWTLVAFGGKSMRQDCKNKRAEMWANMKDWLKRGGVLPADDQELADDLTGPETVPHIGGLVQLESKEKMRERGQQSPNCADALALTFAHPVLSSRQAAYLQQTNREQYDPWRGL